MPDLSSTTVQNVVVTVTSVTGTQISFTFHTPNGNLPSSFGNNIYIWQSGDQIPWQTTVRGQAISVNTPDGSGSFDRLSVTDSSYIIGYAVGPTDPTIKWSNYANVASSAFIPAIGSSPNPPPPPPPKSSSLTILNLGPTSAVASFNFLDGFDPQSSGAWAGIWAGQSVSYYTPPLWSSQCLGNNNSGTVSFNNIQRTRGTYYTIGLYPTGYNADPTKLKVTALAYALTFI
jgi:hypothetical protein